MSEPDNHPRVAVIQDAARLHYAVPLALQRAGALECAFCDWYTPPGSLEALVARLVGRVWPALGRRMRGRYCPDLDPTKVRRNAWLLPAQRWAKLRTATDEEFYRRSARLIGRWVLRSGFGRANALFGFVRSLDPWLCLVARRRGLKTVADQMIAPAAIEVREAAEQQRRWPGWEVPTTLARAFIPVEEQTWRQLDHLTCASDYVRDGLVAEGVPAERISVLPYPVAAREFAAIRRQSRAGPLTVGFVGAVGLRKGAPYFFEAARRLQGRGVRFVMIGPIILADAGVKQAGGAVELVGPVPRSEVPMWMGRFDVFYFPSTCEGSAGAVSEAMTAGLPVVTSPNSGSVVRDGTDGFVAAYDDVDGAVERLGRLLDDADLRQRMGRAARERAAAFSLETYTAGIKAVFERLPF